MQENRSISTPHHPRQLNLAPRRRDEIGTSYHQCDVLSEVIDGHRKLIGPMPITVSYEQIAALLGWHLGNWAKETIVEVFRVIAKLHANSASRRRVQSARAASAVVAFTADVLARALARVDVSGPAQVVQRAFVHARRLALPKQRLEPQIGLESEPGEILEERRFVLRAAADAIVVFDAKQNAPTERTSNPPDVNRVDDMPEVEEARRRGREPRDDRRANGCLERCQVWAEQRIDNQGYVIPFLSPHDPFPPVAHALRDPNGLLAAGADLSPERLLDAYANGIFPWFGDEDPVLWWSPDPRMVLFTSEVHVSRSLRKTIRSGRLQVTLDNCFAQVMKGCAEPRRGQDGTWITEEMTDAYERLFEIGYAHSVETWSDGKLMGGLYGVSLGRMFFGESMFSRVSDASKVALVALVKQIERWGFTCVDCQMSTGHLSSLGAREIPRATFLRHVRSLVQQAPVPSPWRLDADLLGTICT